MKLLIKNGRIINPATKKDQIQDLYVEEGIITQIEDTIDKKDVQIIDANNCWVVPGLIDVHVHLREPGYEYKETIASGSRSAAKGGFTTICPMPNTNPVVDNEILVEYILLKAEKQAVINVLPVGAITKGQKGEELANIGKMKEAGICAISEDGRSVLNASLLKKAMIYSKMFDLPILSHCEDDSLAGSGSMNAGETATILGLKGIPDEAEEIIVARDIMLAEKTGAKLHICHVSTAGSVEIIKRAKEKNIHVTAEVTPHHFTLTEEAVKGFDANAKMNPPLRTKKDVEIMKSALKDGTIDIIATDHAPHHIDEKNCEFEKAANGIVGFETSVALTITELVDKGFLTPMEMIEKMSYNPAKLIGIDKGNLDIGKVADITIIDPEKVYKVDASTFLSKSKNTPFDGREVKGQVKYTIVNGVIKYQL
ncbi:MAG: dihydroorotase [Firmicutes bacterium HGW-Firmicutes-7]|nr:MAG: dihydroorotase [Firmicutes bacterium HGW-Firmicutes-7]